jgi:ribonucleoside-diphosphate reductase alpha chain
MARELGAFPGYDENKPDMLRVMRNHRRARYEVPNNPKARQGLGDYEQLDIKPVGIDAAQFAERDSLSSKHLLQAAQECWDPRPAPRRAPRLPQRADDGHRPTGTIGLLMDCDTTGVEPDFALVKFKKLAGGGYFKIANQSLAPALKNLGYTGEQVHDILKHVLGTLTLEGRPRTSIATRCAAKGSRTRRSTRSISRCPLCSRSALRSPRGQSAARPCAAWRSLNRNGRPRASTC